MCVCIGEGREERARGYCTRRLFNILNIIIRCVVNVPAMSFLIV